MGEGRGSHCAWILDRRLHFYFFPPELVSTSLNVSWMQFEMQFESQPEPAESSVKMKSTVRIRVMLVCKWNSTLNLAVINKPELCAECMCCRCCREIYCIQECSFPCWLGNAAISHWMNVSFQMFVRLAHWPSPVYMILLSVTSGAFVNRHSPSPCLGGCRGR